MHDHANEYGADEMVVIGEKHSMSIAELPLDILTESLYVCSERMIDLARDPNLISMIVRTGWNNDDREAGMTHPLWHIHASDIVYQRPKEEMDCCTHYYLRLDKERCLFCDMIRQELETSERTIWETEHFLVMAPFASRYTFETWIIPKSHHANFECLAGTANYGQVIPELASLIQRVMKNLEALLGPRFAYTAMLYNAPQKFNTCKREDIPLLYHWRVRIAPRFIEQSSEEDATGMSIIKLFPEHAAIILRQTPDEIRDWLSASI